MKKMMFLVVLAALSLAIPAWAASDPVSEKLEAALDTFTEGCRAELTTYCKDVTPGEGRVLACLYAFGDKLSPRCEYAVYDSMGQLNRTLINLSYAINECSKDMETYCSNIKPGEGRLLDCLKRNEDKVSSRCNTALKDAGWKK